LTISAIAIWYLKGPNCQALAGPLAVCDTIYDEMEEVPTESAKEEVKENNLYEENLVLLQVQSTSSFASVDFRWKCVSQKHILEKRMIC
jgi:hypothetical protein